MPQVSKAILQPEQLIRRAHLLDFQTTAELEPNTDIIGQPRGMQALRFGRQMPAYHIFLGGSDGVGRLSALRHVLAEHPPAEGLAHCLATTHAIGFSLPYQDAHALQQALANGDISAKKRKALQKQYPAAQPFLDTLPEGRFKILNPQPEALHVLHEPSYQNLMGYFSYQGNGKRRTTDFWHVYPGALLTSRVLVMEAEALLEHHRAWDALMLALKTRRWQLNNRADHTPPREPILQTPAFPLDTQIVLLGSMGLYEELYDQSTDFRELFRIRAEFVDDMPRTLASEKQIADFVAQQCHTYQLPPFSHAAVAKLIELASRWAGDQCRLTTHFGELASLIQESAFFASEVVEPTHVQTALDAREFRANEGEIFERDRILNGEIFVDTDGKVTGQVNGLFVIGSGEYRYAVPNRITATVYMGGGGITQIDRSTDLTGNIHDKGLMILESYINARYGQEYGLNFGASLLFDQNYSDIDGDSASVAQLYALLSALANTPARQDLAITGSFNQRGEVQPIGAATLKIEGFFKLCQARGLTRTQGVIIPHTNISELMLADAVVSAVQAGAFHIYAISHVDEGIALLTGRTAKIIHKRVEQRLRELSEKDEDDDEKK